MKKYDLNQTCDSLRGPTKEHILVQNQWAAIALNEFHQNSRVEFEFDIDGTIEKSLLSWDSNFSTTTMNENVDKANHGGVAIAFFVMAVLLDYKYVEQSEIGEGVDYLFKKNEPNDDDLNFLNDSHFVEVSGILKETQTNTLVGRIKKKHDQINNGTRREESSSVIVTLFSSPKTVKELHR
jgi:hypothetical protein